MATLDLNRYEETPLRGKIRELLRGEFLAGATNVSYRPTRDGKIARLVAALARAFGRGRTPVLFTPGGATRRAPSPRSEEKPATRPRGSNDSTTLNASRSMTSATVQHDRAEMEVLFALLAERYERKSVMITSNLVFSKWDQIFKDPMTTAAAIDRVVHHAVVLEFLGPSLRSEVAEERARAASTKRNPAPPADA